jgi:hypothetical protein
MERLLTLYKHYTDPSYKHLRKFQDPTKFDLKKVAKALLCFHKSNEAPATVEKRVERFATTVYALDKKPQTLATLQAWSSGIFRSQLNLSLRQF